MLKKFTKRLICEECLEERVCYLAPLFQKKYHFGILCSECLEDLQKEILEYAEELEQLINDFIKED
jgi:hypothetical protein